MLKSSGEKVESPDQNASRPLPERTGCSAADLRRKYHRNWERTHKDRTRLYHLRKYAKIKDRLKAKRQSPEYKAKMREYLRLYRIKNKARIKALQKRWTAKNAHWIREYRKDYGPRRRLLYRARASEIVQRKRELAKTPKYRLRVRAYCRRKRATDANFAVADRMRASINRAFRRVWIKKPRRTETLLGCSIDEAKRHIESQFGNGMSWVNRSSFVIDHYVPIAAFDLSKDDEVAVAFCWKNLRPITQSENSRKSDTIPDPLPDWLPKEIAARIVARSKK